ncbi:ABC transporter ATP-binding protein [Enterobacteriaceae bacterium ESL0689]|nr:ABC transporter ATP-binding protein [Enterobacteriaceae bacterium ESL0689]
MSTISVSNVGKAFKLYPNRWARFMEWFLPKHIIKHQLKWVLQDINFTISSGEAVGIIGINGAGKSTLLKMITGTSQPTKGNIYLSGRVAALLELGMGFHPDFTGRQNVYMAAQLMGLCINDIKNLMPQIEAFAEIGDYIDSPIRIYSSGMQMRLAFSVATAIRPDILIVDEALSVGDDYFQHKCFDRIRDFRQQGTTLLIVSHDKQAIQSICDRAILLNAGHIEMEGKPEAVMDYYNALLADKQNQKLEQKVTSEGKIQTISGTGEAEVIELGLFDKNNKLVEIVNVGQPIILRIKVKVNDDIPRLVFGYGIKDRLGQVLYGTNTDLKKNVIKNVKAGTILIYEFSFDINLGPGSYSIQTALVSTDTHLVNNYEWRDLALLFNVVNMDKANFIGLTWLDPKIGIYSE